MVVGPIGDTNLLFPNSPSEDDILSGPNKFVYEWKGSNRWKNVHRPIVISDYIWPYNPANPGSVPADPSNPTDLEGGGGSIDEPYPITDGGGGDDWSIDQIDFPVGPEYGNVSHQFLVRVDPALRNTPSGLEENMYRTDALVSGRDNEYSPDSLGYLVCYSEASTGRALVPYEDRTGFVSQQYNSLELTPQKRWIGAIDLQAVLANYSRKTDCKWRMRAKGRWAGIVYAGAYDQVQTIAKTATGVNIGSPSPATASMGITAANNIGNPVSRTTDWESIPSNARYLAVQGLTSTSYQYYDIFIDIIDPYGAQAEGTAAVGFSTDPELRRSLVSFYTPLNSEMIMLEHGNPKKLDNTSIVQRVLDIDFKSLSANVLEPLPFGPLFFRENGEMFFTQRSGSTIVEARHLATPYDLSSHSQIFNNANGYYNYMDYSSSVDIGFELRDLLVSQDGTMAFGLSTLSVLYSVPLSVPWDLSSAVVGSAQVLDIAGFDAGLDVRCFDITPDGRNLVVCGFYYGVAGAAQVILDTPWDIDTAIYTGYYRQFNLDDPKGITVSSDTSTIFVLDVPDDPSIAYTIYRYSRNI